MKANPWKTPFGLTLLIGSAMSLLIGFFAGVGMRSGGNSTVPANGAGAPIVDLNSSAEAASPVTSPPQDASPSDAREVEPERKAAPPPGADSGDGNGQAARSDPPDSALNRGE